ncbi:MAG: sugar phosphate nucleotidyltransferase [Actinomycetota bacterium]|nr:sugar phosphate nucleotidyltransferase [Actinomycetota bacterium]
MRDVKVLAMVMAGGAGGRMELLTDQRAKPVLPFAGVYRLIDFPLSNCLHSGLSDVWIVEQFHPQSLTDHVSNGRPWDLDRTYGGMRLLHPHLGTEQSGFHEGNADAVYRNQAVVRHFDPDVLVVMSADHVYKLDFNEPIRRHLERGADVTMVTSVVKRDDPTRFGLVQVNGDGRITEYRYKPNSPFGDIAATEVFVFDARKLFDLLESLAERGNDDEESLEDLGDDVLPQLVEAGRAFEYRLEGYWRDVGTIDSYWRAHMELLSSDLGLDLDDPAWPVLTLGGQRPAAHIYRSACNDNSLVSSGCKVAGTVAESVLGRGVIVEEGARVINSVVLHDAVIQRGATVETAIVDAGATIGRGATVGATPEPGAHEGEGTGISPDHITLVGMNASVAPDERVERGSRVGGPGG